ncbi:MAG TPA: hypothetical protein VF856_07465 [Gemmatimonadaceae bacterium]
MAGDQIGNTVLTGLIVTNTPGSRQTDRPPPVSGGPAIVQLQSGVTLQVQAGAQLSLQTFSFSMTTAALATAIPSGNLGLVFRASGLSLVYVSGGTVYSLASSAISGVA